ncbi:protein pns1 [Anaeramoeba ignava]|uniref:Choline transporter-like protein n=1 Tax=Anaeramoeba ignava TaxID=1746090 RepID=A0A9Q0R5J8_ANAIG|nr:protein pns1 [Anaeramoeba ignava]
MNSIQKNSDEDFILVDFEQNKENPKENPKKKEKKNKKKELELNSDEEQNLMNSDSDIESLKKGKGNIVDFFDDSNEEEEEKKSNCKDIWAIFLFVFHLTILFAVSARSNSKKMNENDSNSKYYKQASKSFWILIIISVLIGIIGSFFWIQMMKKYARKLIYFTYILSIVFLAIMAIVMFSLGSFLSGILFTISFIFALILFNTWARRISFSSVLLSSVSEVTQKYPAMIVIAFVFGIGVHIIWIISWVYVGTKIYKIDNNFWNFFVLLAYYWTTNVIKNIVHTTSCGTFASYYFANGNMPDDPTLKSFKRAITFSFGSICFGSLVIAILKTVKQMVQYGMRSENEYIKTFFACIFGFVEWLTEFFNQFAFVYVATYGTSFVESSKKAYHLLQNRGLTAVINDDLIWNVILLASIVTGIVSAIISGIVTYLMFDESSIWIVISLISLLIAMSISLVVLEVISSGVTTFFVCFAEAPQNIKNLDSELSEKLRLNYHFDF